MRKYITSFFVSISVVIFFLQAPFIFQLLANAATGPVTVQCTCQHKGVPGQGNNGFNCNGPAPNPSACSNLEDACDNDPGHIFAQQAAVPGIHDSAGSPAINWVGVSCQLGNVQKTQVCAPDQCTMTQAQCQQAQQATGQNVCTANGCTNGKDCAINPNSNQQTVQCQCTGPKNSKGQQTEVECINYTTANPKWTNAMTCGDQGVCVQSPNLSYPWVGNGSIPVPGLACEQNCTCDHPGLTGDGNNSWSCAGGNSGACNNIEDACDNGPGTGNFPDFTISGTSLIHCTDTTECTCDNSGGDSKVSCSATVYTPAGPGLTPMPTGELQDPVPNADCGSKGQVCDQGAGVYDSNFRAFNQHYHGIACEGSVTLPPPPSPPCVTWSNGQCLTFATGFGSIATNPAGFVQSIFALLLSISGGVALLLIIRAGYQLLTSQGKPEQLQAGRDQLIAAIVGLVFLIFSLVLLQLIGVDILHLPGFSQ